MISSLLMFGLGPIALAYPQDTRWVTAAIQSPRAAQSLPRWRAIRQEAVSVTIAEQVTPIPGGGPIQLIEGPAPGVLPFAKDLIGEQQAVGKLLKEQKPEAAYRHLSLFLKDHPDLAVMMNSEVGLTALASGRYQEAFEHLVIQIDKLGAKDDFYYLQLSLASAAMGETYPGQAQYCQGVVQREYLSENHSAYFDFPAKLTSKPGDVELLSLLALGMRNGEACNLFLERALQLDPTNVKAARHLIKMYGYRSRYTQLRRIASNISSRLPAGPSRDEFLRKIAEVEGLPDQE